MSYCVFLKAPELLCVPQGPLGWQRPPRRGRKVLELLCVPQGPLSYCVFLRAPVGGSGHPEGDFALDVFSGLPPPLLCARVCG